MMTKLYRDLFFTGFLQVILVVVNTYQIAVFVKRQDMHTLMGILIVGFLISFIWSWNVKKIAFGGLKDRIFYSLGAAFGSVVGVVLGYLIY